MLDNEYIDIYDENMINTGETVLRGTPLKKDQFQKIIELWIIDENGQYLIQRRAENKKMYPNLWSCTVSGYVQSGETDLEACVRETQEELGIKLNIEDGYFYKTIIEENHYYMVWTFFTKIDLKNLFLNKEEVSAVKWATKDNMENLNNKGKMILWEYMEDYFHFISKAIKLPEIQAHYKD